MNIKPMTIEFSSALSNIVEQNPSFDIARLRIAYTGKNRNNTFISKESFEKAIPTMFNCPVVANYMRKQDEIGSHDGEFVKTKDGEVKYVNVTQPVGLIPESAQWNWEEVDDNGVMHQYLCSDVLLWKRQEAYEKIKDNGITSQSMEIEVTDGKMLDDYYAINDFRFTAFCLLGTAEPCFEGAALFTFSEQEDFKQQYREMLKEFKLAYAGEDTTKEGKENLLSTLLEKYSVTLEDLTFEVEGLSDEELESKFAEVFDDGGDDDTDDTAGEDEPAEEPEAEPAPASEEPDEPSPQSDDDEEEDKEEEEEEEPTEPTDDDDDVEGSPARKPQEFGLSSQISSTLREEVMKMETLEDDWGAHARYYMIDFDESASEVYFEDATDWKLYGCTYDVDGDAVSINLDQIKRKKYAIVDFEGGENDIANYSALQSFMESVNPIGVDAEEFARLQKFEADILKKEREDVEKALFERFDAELADIEEYKTLKTNASNYSVEELRKEIFAIKGCVDFNMEESSKPEQKACPGIVFEGERKSKDSIRNLFSWKNEEN